MLCEASPYTPGMAKETRTPMTTERDYVIGVRVSKTERAKIEAAAAALGLKASQYLRMVALRQADKDATQ